MSYTQTTSPQIILTLREPIIVFDRQLGSIVTLEAGEHFVERVPNPFGSEDTPWLMIVGTSIGASEAYWKNFSQPNNQVSILVQIQENTP